MIVTICRPGHRVSPPASPMTGSGRDPYGAESRFSIGVAAFCQHQRLGLWVPAFAGTTGIRAPRAVLQIRRTT
jgi:hypothetical protein